MKNLVYYSTFGAGYQRLISLSLESMAKKSDMNNIDVLIFCDERTAFDLKINNLNVNFFIISEPLNAHSISYYRYKINEYLKASEYNKFLYLDTDTIVCDDINKIFNFMEDEEAIYTNQGYGSDLSHPSYTFDLSKEEVSYIKQNKLQGINSGVFGFAKNNLQFFRDLTKFIDLNQRKFECLDQPYFGTFLLRKKQKHIQIGNPLHSPNKESCFVNNEALVNNSEVDHKKHVILHYAGSLGNAYAKIQKMEIDFLKVMSQ